MASGPITSWEIDGEKVETVSDFIFGGSKITADGDCSHEIKRHLRLGWRRKWQPTPVFMPGRSHGPRSLVGYNPWGREESDTTERLLCVCVCVLIGRKVMTNPDSILKSRDITLPTNVYLVKAMGGHVWM